MNVAFVGAELHFVYTRSSRFFIDLLRTTLGPVTVFTSEWRWIHLPRRRWDLVVFWQFLPERWELDCLDAANVVLVPMYDECPKNRSAWEIYGDCKVLCFSETLGGLLEGYGLRVLTARYFPPVPAKGVPWDGEGLRLFFWPRKPDLTWTHVRPLVAGGPWSRVHLHVTDNVSEVPLDLAESDRGLPITRSSWFSTPSDYLRLLGEHQVFFAPRRSEGIGMSFLEAMSLGMAVVAPNDATMNEYITSNVNGYLYDPEAPVAPAWIRARSWGEQARRSCAEGRQRWLQAIPRIRAFMVDGQPPRAAARADSRQERATREARPGYLRYRAWKLALAARRTLLPCTRRRGS